MKIADQDTEEIVDLLRSPKISRQEALSLLDALCRTVHTDGIIIGSHHTSTLINRTLDAISKPRAARAAP